MEEYTRLDHICETLGAEEWPSRQDIEWLIEQVRRFQNLGLYVLKYGIHWEYPNDGDVYEVECPGRFPKELEAIIAQYPERKGSYVIYKESWISINWQKVECSCTGMPNPEMNRECPLHGEKSS